MVESNFRLVNWGEAVRIFHLEKRHQVLLLVIATLVLLGSGYKLFLSKNDDMVNQDLFLADKTQETGAKGSSVPAENKVEKIMVHVIGAVEKPGVYKLPADARVVDAVNVAVPAADARLDLLNLAAPLPDGQQVVVWSEEDYQQFVLQGDGDTGTAPLSTSLLPVGSSPSGLMSAAGTNSTGLININTAGQSELETLPGIGPALAGRIIEYRQSNGRFLSAADLKNVSGIGDKKFAQIEDKITVN